MGRTAAASSSCVWISPLASESLRQLTRNLSLRSERGQRMRARVSSHGHGQEGALGQDRLRSASALGHQLADLLGKHLDCRRQGQRDERAGREGELDAPVTCAVLSGSTMACVGLTRYLYLFVVFTLYATENVFPLCSRSVTVDALPVSTARRAGFKVSAGD